MSAKIKRGLGRGIEALFETKVGQQNVIASSGGNPKPSYKDGWIYKIAFAIFEREFG